MSFDPNQPGDWSCDSSAKPKRRDPVLDLFSSSESLELEPIEEDDDDIVPPKAVEAEKTTAEPTKENPAPRNSSQKRSPAERTASRQPKPASTKSATAKPAPRDPAPATVAESAPPTKQPVTSHWAKLAGMLGIGGKAARDSREAEPDPVAAERPREEVPKRDTVRPRPRPQSATPRATDEPRQPIAAESEIAWEPPTRQAETVVTTSAKIPEPVAEDTDDEPRFLDGDEYVEFEIEELDPEGKLSLSKGAVSLDDPSSDIDREKSSRRDAPRRGSPRRESSQRDSAPRDSSPRESISRDASRSGNRSRSDRNRLERPKRNEGAFAEGLTAEPAATPAPQRRNPRDAKRDDQWEDGPDAESRRRPEPDDVDSRPELSRPVADRDADDPDRPRKRRRRRGRGKAADGAKTATGPDTNPEAIRDDIDPLDDVEARDIDPRDIDPRDIEGDGGSSSKDPRRTRKQGDRINSNRVRNKSRNRDDDGPDDESGDGDERARKTVTTWSTAISSMIERNMASRKGRPSGGGNRGNSGNRPRGNSGPPRRR